MTWTNDSGQQTRHRRSQIVLFAAIFALLGLVLGLIWYLINHTDDTPVNTEVSAPITIDESQTQNIEEQISEPPEFNTEELQETVDNWVSSVKGEPSVTLMSVDGKILASHNKDQSYFAASIYKLYVAYEGYRAAELSVGNPNDIYLNGNTRLECLDLMIRESDSPCAEKMWVELGKKELTTTLKTYGIENTDMTSITTTSEDAAIMLAKIASGEDLSAESQAAFMQSMKEQVYRDALNVGFEGSAVVYNKIGFREQVEYHDTAIVEFPDGRRLIVSVLTENVGSKNIATLGEQISEAVGEQ